MKNWLLLGCLAVAAWSCTEERMVDDRDEGLASEQQGVWCGEDGDGCPVDPCQRDEDGNPVSCTRTRPGGSTGGPPTGGETSDGHVTIDRLPITQLPPPAMPLPTNQPVMSPPASPPVISPPAIPLVVSPAIPPVISPPVISPVMSPPVGVPPSQWPAENPPIARPTAPTSERVNDPPTEPVVNPNQGGLWCPFACVNVNTGEAAGQLCKQHSDCAPHALCAFDTDPLRCRGNSGVSW